MICAREMDAAFQRKFVLVRQNAVIEVHVVGDEDAVARVSKSAAALEALVWPDEQGATRLSYNDRAYLAGPLDWRASESPRQRDHDCLTCDCDEDDRTIVRGGGSTLVPEERFMTSTNSPSTIETSNPRDGRLARWAVIAVLIALLVAACVLGYLGWTSTEIQVPESGYVALVLGVVFSLVVGAGLMALVFYSSRGGYDEPAVLIKQPESDENDVRGRPG
jgi:hypothetical protein